MWVLLLLFLSVWMGIISPDGGAAAADVRLRNGDLCSGRVEMKLMTQSGYQWAGVCDAGWDKKDAEVVCRQLGCGGQGWAITNPGHAHGEKPLFGQGLLGVWVRMKCRRTDNSLIDCPYDRLQDCDVNRAAGVICSGAAAAAEVRLMNGDRCSGKVFLKGQNGHRWHGVCDDDWDMIDARVVCSQLGCGDPLRAVTNPGYAYGEEPLFGRGPFLQLNTVMCTGNESSLIGCHRWPLQHCGSNRQAGVICSALESSGVSPLPPSVYQRCPLKVTVPPGGGVTLSCLSGCQGMCETGQGAADCRLGTPLPSGSVGQGPCWIEKEAGRVSTACRLAQLHIDTVGLQHGGDFYCTGDQKRLFTVDIHTGGCIRALQHGVVFVGDALQTLNTSSAIQCQLACTLHTTCQLFSFQEEQESTPSICTLMTRNSTQHFSANASVGTTSGFSLRNCSGTVLSPIRSYTLLQESVSWEEAQRRCNQSHTGLAVILSKQHLQYAQQALGGSTLSTWLGLHTEPAGQQWGWTGMFQKWGSVYGDSRCVYSRLGEWHISSSCDSYFTSMCQYEYSVSGESVKVFRVVKVYMSWEAAEKFCRHAGGDLASILSQQEHTAFQEVAQAAGVHEWYFIWIGLSRSDRALPWMWTNGKLPMGSAAADGQKCGVFNGTHWSPEDCSHTHTFLCYKDGNISSVTDAPTTNPLNTSTTQTPVSTTTTTTTPAPESTTTTTPAPESTTTTTTTPAPVSTTTNTTTTPAPVSTTTNTTTTPAPESTTTTPAPDSITTTPAPASTTTNTTTPAPVSTTTNTTTPAPVSTTTNTTTSELACNGSECRRDGNISSVTNAPTTNPPTTTTSAPETTTTTTTTSAPASTTTNTTTTPAPVSTTTNTTTPAPVSTSATNTTTSSALVSTSTPTSALVSTTTNTPTPAPVSTPTPAPVSTTTNTTTSTPVTTTTTTPTPAPASTPTPTPESTTTPTPAPASTPTPTPESTTTTTPTPAPVSTTTTTTTPAPEITTTPTPAPVSTTTNTTTSAPASTTTNTTTSAPASTTTNTTTSPAPASITTNTTTSAPASTTTNTTTSAPASTTTNTTTPAPASTTTNTTTSAPASITTNTTTPAPASTTTNTTTPAPASITTNTTTSAPASTTTNTTTSELACNGSECRRGELVYVNSSVSWLEALDWCEQRGLRLLHILSEATQTQLTLLLSSLQPAVDTAWVGLERCMINPSAPWEWVELPVSYSNWHKDFPRNPCSYHCGQVTKAEPGNYTWLDDCCSHKHPFVCQNKTK